MSNKFIKFLIIPALILLLTAGYLIYQGSQKQSQISSSKVLDQNQRPDYLIVLLGDSMTQALGNSDELREYMAQYYPGRTFDFLNYGFGSTNILSVEKRLTEWTFYGRDFQPIMDIDFDLILIESFGHNPLSDYPLEEGLSKQNEALDKIIEIITSKQTREKIIFVATISPNSKTYAYRQVDMDGETRKKWTTERVAYIKNHIKYAAEHNIPVINIFKESLDSTGDGNEEYISETDYIHPSPKGIRFISKQISDFIFENRLLN